MKQLLDKCRHTGCVSVPACICSKLFYQQKLVLKFHFASSTIFDHLYLLLHYSDKYKLIQKV